MTDLELEPMPPEIDALLDAERGYGEETVARKDRVLGRLQATTAAIDVADALGKNRGTGLSRFVQTKAAIAIAAAMAGAIGGGAVGYRLGGQAEKPRAVDIAQSPPRVPEIVATTNDPILPTPVPPSASTAPLASTAPSTAPLASTAPSTAPLASTPPAGNRAPVAPTARPHAAAQGEDDLALELSLVQMARAALTRGNYAATIDATERHARAFPKGHLAEERESLAIQALVGAGKDDEARARAARFHAAYPKSPQRPAVDAAIRAIP